ncbi:hypothetical protein [Candidatus Blochmanniella vafra]|uniref:hypothetical protein n=1 Tax=Candidatus Blochmanniella vafra TaxID=251535 RepID=UPI0002E4AE7E|nr:hypothetical protein [Candidatus Blochmannia vafer]
MQFFCALLLTGCLVSKEMNKKNYCCAINADDKLQYLKNRKNNYFLYELKIPKNLGIIFPDPYTEYNIPAIDTITIKKIDTDFTSSNNLNICPPVILNNVLN